MPQEQPMDAQVICDIQPIHSINRTPMSHAEGRDDLVYGRDQPGVKLAQTF